MPPASQAASNSALKDLLECPVCLTVMQPPINQCPNGHAFCSTCKGKLKETCPIITCSYGIFPQDCLTAGGENLSETAYSTITTTMPPASQAASNSALKDLLECPVCLTVMQPPINQCPNGHAFCSTCKGKLKETCPICRELLGNIRCIALEKVAETLGLSCRYEHLGCKETISYNAMKTHEQNCRFRPYRCPTPGDHCSVTGAVDSLVTHLKKVHKVEVVDKFTFNHRYVKSHPVEDRCTWMIHLFKCSDHRFCLHFEAFIVGITPVYIAFLRIMGENEDGKKYKYSLEVEGRERKLSFESIPRSIRESHKTVRDSLDGLIIPRPTALFISDQKNDLNLKYSTESDCKVTYAFYQSNMNDINCSQFFLKKE